MIKKIFENTFVKLVIALGVVSVFSGAVLVLVYQYTNPKILENLNNESVQAVRTLFPDMETAVITHGTGEGEKAIVKVTDKDKKLLGYAFKAKGNGYQGEIKLAAGLDGTLSTLQGIVVLESQETPGLGAEISGKDFRKQFNGLSVKHPIEYVKNQKPSEPYEIEAITGATISSRAVVNILNKRIKEVSEVLKGK
ncbi:MAG: RnfABCDGE type electron transport complex subunit G [Candidatus Omnitrophota bacterium]